MYYLSCIGWFSSFILDGEFPSIEVNNLHALQVLQPAFLLFKYKSICIVVDMMETQYPMNMG